MPSQLKIRIWNAAELPSNWFKRAEAFDPSLEKRVKTVIRRVRTQGDNGLLAVTYKFDRAKLSADKLRVTSKEIQAAYNKVTEEQVVALRLMKGKVASFEQLALKQLGVATSQDGITIQNILFPIESVGCYVPGGQAAYPSTVVMTAVPAKVAGVTRIVVCSPPNR